MNCIDLPLNKEEIREFDDLLNPINSILFCPSLDCYFKVDIIKSKLFERAEEGVAYIEHLASLTATSCSGPKGYYSRETILKFVKLFIEAGIIDKKQLNKKASEYYES